MSYWKLAQVKKGKGGDMRGGDHMMMYVGLEKIEHAEKKVRL